MNAARALRVARRRAGLSQTELAIRAGVAKQVVNAIERAASIPRVDTLDRLLAAAGYDLKIEPRLGSRVERESIRAVLRIPSRARLSRVQIRALDLLCGRYVRFVMVGDAAARLHGAPVQARTIELVLGTDRINPLRLDRARQRSADLLREVTFVAGNYDSLILDATELPWLPGPSFRVMNSWLGSPSGFVASIDDLLLTADAERRNLLAAVQEERDAATPGQRINRSSF